MATFDQYRQLRQDIAGSCDELEVIWGAATHQTVFEHAAGASMERGEVESLLAEVRGRLAADTIEVGIFGQVKRGKSTLINALVGQTVSSVSIRPETASPVWVESGSPRSIVIYADGFQEEISDLQEGAARATQRHKLLGRGKHGEVVRVRQFLEIDWLPTGLRLVDTPGLSDPSMVQDYEDRTLAELDRVAAAVFVIVTPPGADREEVRLLKSLGRRGIDKVFVVCNFWSDVWTEESERDQALDYVRNVVIEGALESGSAPAQDVRLYGVNAKLAVKATDSNDSSLYEASGVGALRRDIEDFLTSGALLSMTAAAAEKLQRAQSIVLATLQTRKKLLQDPGLLGTAVKEKEAAVSASNRVINEIEKEMQQEGRRLGSVLGEILRQPYHDAIVELESATTVDFAQQIERHLQLRSETAASKASYEFDTRTAAARRNAERRLHESFGTEGTFASPVAAEFRQTLAQTGQLGAQFLGKVDWGAVALSSVAAGAGAGAIGASLAGGAGTALIAAGPVGWLIGGGIAIALGLFGGALAGGVLTHGRLKPEVRSQLLSQLMQAERNAMSFGDEIATRWSNATMESLNNSRSRYLRDKEHELSSIRQLASDKQGRQAAIAEVDRLISRIR